jgi:formylglycine-generating enzyme required for sulfatase activity
VAPKWINDGLVAYYPFNGNAKDESGSGGDGVVEGGKFVIDRHNSPDSCLELRQVGDCVTVSPYARLNSIKPTEHSVSFWLSSDYKQDKCYVVSRNAANNYQWYYLFSRSGSGDLFFDAGTGHGTKRNGANSCVTSFVDAGWNHAVISTSPVSTTVYVNGLLRRRVQPGVYWPAVNTAPLLIGRTNHEGRPSGQVLGKIDDIRVYDRPLSGEEAKTLFEFESRTAVPAIPPSDGATARLPQHAFADSLGVPVESSNSIGMTLVLIPPGEFTMGSPPNEAEREPNETSYRVTLTQPFSISAHEVTQSQYERVTGKNPSRFQGESNPVEMVSWNDATEFCRLLSLLPKERMAGNSYRLPTESEWEYACRAGTATKYSYGDDDTQLSDYAWFDRNSNQTSHPVGQKKPNPWGLYDMHGNVWEWCHDWYGDYPGGTVVDPSGSSSGTKRVYRGGSWGYLSVGCRSALRTMNVPDYRLSDHGFRVVRISLK